MKIETKYNLGDEINVESHGKTQKRKVMNISVDVDRRTGTTIEYWTKNETSGEYDITDEKDIKP